MELFVINRLEEVDSSVTKEEEQSKLDKVLKKIEKRKKQRAKQKEKLKQNPKEKPVEGHQHKRQLKANLVPVPENRLDEFIEKDVSNTGILESDTRQKLNHETLEGFTILGSENQAKKAKVKRVLPKWLLNPTVISSNLQELTTKVSKIKQLDKATRNLLKTNGIEYFFPVQAKVIPWLIESHKHCEIVIPRDICVSAPTGSGKTLAFVLPVVQSLKRHTVRKIRALVILPTQDLAVQVFKTFKLYCQGSKLEVSLVTAKTSLEEEQRKLVGHSEAFGYFSKADILVCTAGRLVNHLTLTKGFNLQSLEFLIIDEADRVLDNVQNDWLYHLEKHICKNEPSSSSAQVLNLLSLQKHRQPQKLLFSATLSQDPEKLQKLSLFQPKLFTSVAEDTVAGEETEKSETFVGKYTTPNELTEKYIVCSKELKPLALFNFIKSEKFTRTLVFTHSVQTTHRLMILLNSLFQGELKSEEISSRLTGQNRDKLISKFSNGAINILICTDALGRGIDLPGVQCVISYSVPKHLKTYIHRAGRTARAGEQGLTVTLLQPEQVSNFKEMVKSCVTEVEMEQELMEQSMKNYEEALNKLKAVVNREQKSNLKKTISTKRFNIKNKIKNEQK